MTKETPLILDGTKIAWHKERVEAWQRGERIAPITIDMALTASCNYACHFCYAKLQTNENFKIDLKTITSFLEDCAEIGVKGVSLVSDGESSISPVFEDTIEIGHSLGLDMAVGTNGYRFNTARLEKILPKLTYLRVNITAGEPERYAEIMGVQESYFHTVCNNIKEMMAIKKRLNLDVTIGMQMVLMPEYADQIIPLAKLGKELRPDYLVIKHCSDDEMGQLGVNYGGYKELYPLLKEAESYSDDEYDVAIKWSKIGSEGQRSYQQCYGPPFILQLSGTGLVAPCGMLFNDRYKKYHIGNITETSFKEIWQSDRYWEVMDELASPRFNAQTMCGSLCLQHKVNESLDQLKKTGQTIQTPAGDLPQHLSFI